MSKCRSVIRGVLPSAVLSRASSGTDEQLQHVLEYHEGMLLLRKGRYEDAIDALQLLVKQGVHSDDLDAALGMAALLIRPKDAPLEGTGGRQVLLRAGQAEAYSLLKKYDEGKKTYNDLLQEFPTFPNAHYAYGRFLLGFDELDEAIVQFQQEIKNNPTHIRARMRIAAANYRINSTAGIAYAEEVVKLQPRYPFDTTCWGCCVSIPAIYDARFRSSKPQSTWFRAKPNSSLL